MRHHLDREGWQVRNAGAHVHHQVIPIVFAVDLPASALLARLAGAAGNSPLLVAVLAAAQALGLVAEGASVHLGRGYDSEPTRTCLLDAGSSRKS